MNACEKTWRNSQGYLRNSFKKESLETSEKKIARYYMIKLTWEVSGGIAVIRKEISDGIFKKCRYPCL